MDTGIKRFTAQPLEYFSDLQMKDIHSASLDILEDCGTVVHHEEAVQLLKGAGAWVQDGNRVFIPTGLVEEAIRTAPSRVTIYDRNGTPAMFLEGCNVYYGTGSDTPHILDSTTGERRDALSTDVGDAVRLSDALPHIDFIMSMGLAGDIESGLQYQQKFAAMVRNSTKPHVITADSVQSLRDIVEMAAAVVGGRDQLTRKPLFLLYAEPISPLVHAADAVDKLLYMAENRLPTNYSPGMMAGGTGPVTMAGAIAQANAEILAGLTIHQLKRPGAPFVHGAGMSPMDMMSMQPTYSAPEAMITQAGLTQIGRSLYDLPTWGFGGCSGSKLADEQAVNEAATYLLTAGWMGTNVVHDVGYLEFGLTFSFDLLVMCDEVIGQVRRMMEGIVIDREHLALDAIKRVGPGGHFLSDEHTLDHFKENWMPGITDRNTCETWKSKGGTTMAQRANARVRELLQNHQPEPLPDEVNVRIDAILKRCEERIKT